MILMRKGLEITVGFVLAVLVGALALYFTLKLFMYKSLI